MPEDRDQKIYKSARELRKETSRLVARSKRLKRELEDMQLLSEETPVDTKKRQFGIRVSRLK